MQPKKYFDSNHEDLAQVVKVVRAGFGRNLDFQDIYNHLTNPEIVYLLRNDEIKAMASYSRKRFAQADSLVVEGISVAPEMQGRGIFKILTDHARNGENLLCLRTQNPMMYRALEKYCYTLYPGQDEDSNSLKAAILDFAKYLNCRIDGNGVVKACYGRLLSGHRFSHPRIDVLFRKLSINPSEGDAVLVAGVAKLPPKRYSPGFAW